MGKSGNKDNVFTDPRLDDEDVQVAYEQGGINWDGLTINVYESFRAAMLGKGVIVEAVAGGRWCGLELFYFDDLKFPGLNIPKDYKYQRPLEPSNLEDCALVLRLATEAAEVECTDKESEKRWFSFIESLTSAQTDDRTRLFKLAQGKAQTKPFKVRAIAGGFGAHIIVPPREWFPKQVQTLDARRLLSIMPDVEAEVFMLNYGRAVVGCSDGETLEGNIEHDYRYFAGVVGDASIGKSDLVKRLERVMAMLGFKLSSWNLRENNPFGWADKLMSDWCTLKDVGTEETPTVIKHTVLKQSAGGDTVLDNTKGGADVRIEKPVMGGFLFLANGLNIPKLIMSDDSGVMDRFLPLACYELVELRDKFGVVEGGDGDALNGMTGFMWETISKELGVSSDVLAAWLMRASADLFLSLAGYDIHKGVVRKLGRSTLKSWVNRKRKELRYSFNLNTRSDVVDSIKYSIAYFISEQKRPEFYLELLPDIEFNYMLLSAVVAYTVDPQSHIVSQPLQCLRMQQLAPVTSGEFFRANGRQLKLLPESSQSPLKAFAFVTGLLRTKGDGFGYPSNPVAYASLWRSALKEIPILVKGFESQKLTDSNSALSSLCASIGSIFTSVGKAKGK